jgi:predicted small metal-binding protein
VKDMHCRDVGMNCDFVARGKDEKEILEQAGRHAQQAHGMTVTPELAEKVKGLIHDESSEAHQKSMTRR